MRRRAAVTVVTVVTVVSAGLAAHSASAERPEQVDRAPASRSAASAEDLPWPARLGARAHATERAVPTIDRVVLVPDAATYLDEIASWTPAGHWPVLIADEHLTPLFVRRFRPAQVIRRTAIASPPAARLRARVQQALARAWGATNPGVPPLDAMAAAGHEPPGLVIADPGDPAWTAAVALAAGRGQPVAWVEGRFGAPNGRLDANEARSLQRAVADAAESTGLAWRDLGDAIDAVTICRRMAGGVDAPLPDGLRPNPDDPRTAPPYATTDWLPRHEDGRRWAVAGWIFGDERRAAYMAMCSLFLSRDSIFAVHTYADEEPWSEYDPALALRRLEPAGFEITERRGPDATERAWRTVLREGIDADIVVMTSQGDPDRFKLRVGRGFAGDVPVLDRPAILYLVHSFSLAAPERMDTIGARWLDHGVYAYVGSMHEPFLAAFVPPGPLAARWLAGFPLLAAARHVPPHPLAVPWKVQTLGDPLLTLPAPIVEPNARRRVAAPRGVVLDDVVSEALKTAARTLAPEDFAEAARIIVQLGRDDIALQFWRLARQHTVEAAIAPMLVAPLFRSGRTEELRYAVSLLERPSPVQLDMLWHAYGPLLPRREDEQTLELMLRCVRRPAVHHDLARIAPHIEAVFGEARLLEILRAERDATRRRAVRKGLEGLIDRYDD